MFRNDEIKRLHVSFSFFFIAVFGNRRGIRESDEKNNGMRDFSEKGASAG